jgi:hypothetical protein
MMQILRMLAFHFKFNQLSNMPQNKIHLICLVISLEDRPPTNAEEHPITAAPPLPVTTSPLQPTCVVVQLHGKSLQPY